MKQLFKLFGLKTPAMVQAENPQTVLSELDKIRITDYLWLDISAKLYCLTAIIYGVFSLTVKKSVLGFVLALLAVLFFYGFRGSPPKIENGGLK